MLERVRKRYVGCNYVIAAMITKRHDLPATDTRNGRALLMRRMTLTPQPSPLGRTTQFTAGLVASALLACAAPAAANGDGGGGSGGGPSVPGVTQTRLVEWDLPEQMDGRPGAIAVDHYGNQGGKLWFLTRDGIARVYQFEPPKSLKTESAQWVSWSLNTAFLGPTGGIKKIKTSYDRRFVFLRTVLSVQRIDTITSERVTYPNDEAPSFVSDIATDNHHNVYATQAGTVKRLNASGKCVNQICPETTVTTWEVDPLDQTVGNCTGGVTDPCLAGVAVHPKYQHLVYFADNASNTIGELDTESKSCSCSTPLSKVRYWSLSDLGPEVEGPRQLNIDQDGTLWTVTTSGHLVSLNPKSNYMTKHLMPARLTHDPFGVAPDGGRIGYTDIDTATDEHVVAMLSPKGNAVRVYPSSLWVSKVTQQVTPMCDVADRVSGYAPAVARNVPTTITSKTDGTFIEAMIDENADVTQMRSSRMPLGITPDFDRAVGTFFFAVGETEALTFLTVNRIGVARLPHDHGHKGKHDRDDEDPDDDGKKRGDDDDDDDDGKKNDLDEDDDADGILDVMDDDDDNDGIKNADDHKDSREAQMNQNDVIDAGQASEYDLTVRPNSSVVVATALASNPLAPVTIQLVNAAGAIVAASPATLGTAVLTVLAPAAGDYVVRVKNNGLSGSGIATTVLAREPWPILPVGTLASQ
jgi:hypothetical protein